VKNAEPLVANNRAFAATDAKSRVPEIPFIPHRQVYVLTCIDPRVEPAAVLGLGLGDAIVARCVGGRVTPAVLRDLAWISFLHQEKTPDADWFELMVVHHTDCGSGLLADPGLRREFVRRTDYDDVELASLAVVDPAETVWADVAKLLAAPQVSDRIAISGYSYDLRTGLLTEVVAAGLRTG
jgi:carbonic anhydrase